MPSPQPSSIRVGRRYRANRLDGPYDVLVIGSGIGGLMTTLAISGRRGLPLAKRMLV